MNKEEAIDRLERQIADIDTERFVNAGGTRSQDFNKWRRDTEVLIRNIFGDESRHVREFTSVRYIPNVISASNADQILRRSFLSGLEDAQALLSSMRDEIDEYWREEQDQDDMSAPTSTLVPLNTLELICRRFHFVARQLRDRREGRHTLSVVDEYDAQDLLHALLRLFFDDIRKEESAPSVAGAASRIDFLLKIERIVVEVKKTRDGFTEKDIGEQLIVDIMKYQAHPDADALVCFVYDPEALIGNPFALENDLTGTSTSTHGELDVIVIVEPKN